ncbi:MAG: hypothetical protein NT007_15020 [Candidatus Kapabacteria bacterium]|nr:hypothetical protein [Candidatus Kapabacteria bacterium]
MDNIKNTDIENPIITELRSRISECRKELLKLLDNWHYLQNIVHPQIMFAYDSLFGDLEIEYQEKNRNAAELDRRVELLSIRINKGEKLTEHTIRFVNTMVQSEFHRPDRSAATFIHNRYCNDVVNAEFKEKNELPLIYRKIVKRLHPDINGYTDDFHKFWDNIQEAYRSENLHRLKLFHQTLCYDENEELEDIRLEEARLRSEIHDLEINIASEKLRIQQMKEQEPFIFEDKLNDRFWVARRKRKLQERILQIEKHIQYNKKLLSTMMSDKSPAVEIEITRTNYNQSKYKGAY